MTFPRWSRLALGLLVALLGYLVGGELHISQELRGAISALTLLLASSGIVPPTAKDLPALSQPVRYLLTGLGAVAAYIVSTVDVDPTLRGVIVAVLALGASLGIIPGQVPTPTVGNLP